jgi:nucleoside-diphosphate-sugar epimerase
MKERYTPCSKRRGMLGLREANPNNIADITKGLCRMPEILDTDIELILSSTRKIWKELSGARVFLTGGSGYIGRWLLASFVRANERYKLDAQVVVLARDPDKFLENSPELVAHPSIRVIGGDVQTYTFPEGRFTHIIHAAFESDPRAYAEHPMRMLGMMLSGARRVLDFSLQSGTARFLLVSSGAVYGRQPQDVDCIPEDYAGEPDVRDPCSTLGEANRLSETLCLTYARHYGLQVKIARCFHSFGPFMKSDSNIPVARYMLEALRGGPIRINGDGVACNSYLYGADLAAWLWTILIKGRGGHVYNVGSDQPISNVDLARLVGRLFDPPVDILIDQELTKPGILERYVPSISRAQQELNLSPTIPLKDAIERSIKWFLSSNH